MQKKIKVTFKRQMVMGREVYLVEALVNAGSVRIGENRFARIGDEATAQQVDYVCEKTKFEVLVH